ncbi:GGDEF domain-containing protein [Litoribacillus peritrichatus]|uniref:diguanylate cyclase n=1 Tax=Litoribacillus peritrichatus TaxID=718191 RepID=A0ABP7N2T8_9GAMM
MTFVQRLNKKQALLLCWSLSALFTVFFMFFHWLDFMEEQKQHDQLADQIAESAAIAAQERIHNVLNNLIVLSKLIASQPEVKAIASQQQEAELSTDKMSHLKILLEEIKGAIVLIANRDQKVILLEDEYQGYLSTNAQEINYHLTKAMNDGQNIAFFYDKKTESSDIYAYIRIDDGPETIGAVVIDFSLSSTWQNLGKHSSKVFIANKFNEAMRLGTNNIKPINLIFSGHASPQAQTKATPPEASQADHVHRLWINANQSLHIHQTSQYGINVYRIPQLFKGRTKLVSLPISEHDGWQLLVFTDAENVFESLAKERDEALYVLTIILIFVLILDRFIRYHFTIQSLTYIDALTGLNNRTHLNLFLPHTISTHDRGEFNHLGVLLMDIDKFKSVNDTYGHDIGDKVLRMVAQTLKTNSRTNDLLYRYGGEEFLILSNGNDYDSLNAFAERLRLAVESMNEVKIYVPDGVTISVGVTERHPKEDPLKMFSRVDGLLYKAKKNGRNRVESEP